jgi:hypothetical protein
VFSARDARTLNWAQVRNVSDGGIFLGADNMNLAGADGISTPAIRARHSNPTTGPIYASDPDRVISADLRSIKVTIRYPAGSSYRTYS